MKKLIVLLMVAAITGAVAFAQDAPAAPAAPTVTFSGYVGAGLLAGAGNRGSAVSFYDYNNGSSGVRFVLNGLIDGGKYGAKFGLATSLANNPFPSTTTAGVTFLTASNLAFDETLGWVYIADKLVKLSVGNLDDGQFSTYVDGDNSWDNGPSWGAEVAINPIPGLAIGYYLPYGAANAAPDLKTAFGNSQVAAVFTVPSVVGIKAGYGFAPDADTNTSKFWVGASLLAVPNFVLQADFELYNIGADAQKGAVDWAAGLGSYDKIWEKVAYTFGIVTPSVLSEQSLGSDLASIRIQPAVSIALTGLTPSLTFNYETNSDNQFSDPAWVVEPAVTIPVGPKTNFLTGFDVFSGSNALGDLHGGQPALTNGTGTGFDFFFETEVNF